MRGVRKGAGAWFGFSPSHFGGAMGNGDARSRIGRGLRAGVALAPGDREGRKDRRKALGRVTTKQDHGATVGQMAQRGQRMPLGFAVCGD